MLEICGATNTSCLNNARLGLFGFIQRADGRLALVCSSEPSLTTLSRAE